MSPLGSAACVSCVRGLSKKIRLIREICVHIKAKSSCSFKSERDILNTQKVACLNDMRLYYNRIM